jgi:hypothetical protein
MFHCLKNFENSLKKIPSFILDLQKVSDLFYSNHGYQMNHLYVYSNKSDEFPTSPLTRYIVVKNEY